MGLCAIFSSAYLRLSRCKCNLKWISLRWWDVPKSPLSKNDACVLRTWMFVWVHVGAHMRSSQRHWHGLDQCEWTPDRFISISLNVIPSTPNPTISPMGKFWSCSTLTENSRCHGHGSFFHATKYTPTANIVSFCGIFDSTIDMSYCELLYMAWLRSIYRFTLNTPDL